MSPSRPLYGFLLLVGLTATAGSLLQAQKEVDAELPGQAQRRRRVDHAPDDVD